MNLTRLPSRTCVLFSVFALAFLVAGRAEPDDVAEPRAALKAFLAADAVEELLPLVANREVVEGAIRDYYKDGVREAIEAERMECVSRGLIPGTRFEACLYMVRVGRNDIPVSVEQTKAGYRVDWVSFTQFHDRRLEKFLADPDAGDGRFLVQLRRSHYFGNEVSDLDGLICFRVRSPIAPFLDAPVFARKGTEEAEEMLEHFRWSRDYRPVVELKWVKPATGTGAPRIELVKVVRQSWRR